MDGVTDKGKEEKEAERTGLEAGACISPFVHGCVTDVYWE